MLDRELDEIEDVRRELEAPNLVEYDQLSDDYFRAIDLTTKPGMLTSDEEGKLSRSITRLNDNGRLVVQQLGKTPLLDAYSNVATQISYLNQTDPSRRHIPPLLYVHIV